LTKQAEKLKTICACKSADLIYFLGLQTKYPSGEAAHLRLHLRKYCRSKKVEGET
jgi:hypothetical protein